MIKHQNYFKKNTLVKIKKWILCCLGTFSLFNASAQLQTITYELNGRNQTDLSNNPFQKFIGEWTLKNDDWTQNWGGETETIKIPKHHTITTPLNTDNSLLSIIDGPEPNGHIFWSYNPNTKEVDHLSSFGAIRAGVGKGKIDELGNVELKIGFEGEPENTYRIYKYTWLSEDEYHMKSVQYLINDEPTGLFYEGNFMRIHRNKKLKEEIADILKILDNNKISKEEQIAVYSEDVIHMAPNHEVINGKPDLLAYLNEQKAYGYSDMEHRIIEFSQHGNIVILRGEVEGMFHPINKKEGIAFKTKNLFVFDKIEGELKIVKVIYNMSPKN